MAREGPACHKAHWGMKTLAPKKAEGFTTPRADDANVGPRACGEQSAEKAARRSTSGMGILI